MAIVALLLVGWLMYLRVGKKKRVYPLRHFYPSPKDQGELGFKEGEPYI